MTDFHEIQFPADLTDGRGGQAYRGGPLFNTTILSAASGAEQRNMNWMRSLAKYNVGHIVKDAAGKSELLEFFNGRMGMKYGFRFKDWLDYKVAPIVTASPPTGVLYCENNYGNPYRLAKLYTDRGGYRHYRLISKPCTGLVTDATGYTPPEPQLYWGNSLCTLGTDYDWDLTTGEVWLAYDPGWESISDLEDSPVTWGGDFDVPVRFTTDVQRLVLQNFGDTDWPMVELTELKLNPRDPLPPIVPSPPGLPLVPARFDAEYVEYDINASPYVTVYITGFATEGLTITFESDDESVLTTDASISVSSGLWYGWGYVYPQSAGTANISATYNGVSVTATVKVFG